MKRQMQYETTKNDVRLFTLLGELLRWIAVRPFTPTYDVIQWRIIIWNCRPPSNSEAFTNTVSSMVSLSAFSIMVCCGGGTANPPYKKPHEPPRTEGASHISLTRGGVRANLHITPGCERGQRRLPTIGVGRWEQKVRYLLVSQQRKNAF